MLLGRLWRTLLNVLKISNFAIDSIEKFYIIFQDDEESGLLKTRLIVQYIF